MRHSFIVPLCLVAGLSQPATAQDFFQSFERMVEPNAPASPAATPGQGAGESEPRDPPPRPRPRPDFPENAGEIPATQAPAATDAPAEPDALPLPRPRPDDEASDARDEAEPETPAASDDEPAAEPKLSEPRVYQAACPALLMGLIEAEPLPPIADGTCGERSPLSVTGVLANGRMVPLSSPATLNCAMASALPRWVETVDGYLRSREDTHIVSVNVGTSYFCRPRNNAEGADISEHGFANAFDVIGFSLADGTTISVEEGWVPSQLPEGRLLRFAHGAACAGFTTVLGPQANALHEDHFHLDLGCHGQSCMARLCE
jgi:hypothetical protein